MAPVPDRPSAFATAWSQRHVVAPTPARPGLFLALAPMDGITDWTYRGLLTDLDGGQSGISLCVSEFVRVTDVRVPAKVIVRHCPELLHGGRTAAGVPVFVQLLGGDPGPMAETAMAAAELGALGIDLNFGCPAKTVNNHDGGAVILRTPARVESIVARVRAALPAALPLTVKIRLGWDDAEGVAELARAAEAGGAAWLTIHGRTRKQGYRPPVNWTAIGHARRAVDIPVVANGDLITTTDLLDCAADSGCHAFMIGRGAMARPELFREARGWTPIPGGWSEHLGLIEDYAHRMVEAGRPLESVTGRIKQWLRLGSPGNPPLAELFDRIKRLRTLEEALATLRAARPSLGTRRAS